jgi:hypothetical protein
MYKPSYNVKGHEFHIQYVDQRVNFEIQFATFIILNNGVQKFLEFSDNISMFLS